MKDVLLLVPTRPEVLGVIQYSHDVTNTGIRATINAVQTKYTWNGLCQDVEDNVSILINIFIF